MLPGETVQLLTAGTITDPYSGESTSSWVLPDGQAWATPPSEVDVPDVLVEPRPSGEPLQDARNQVTSGHTLYLQTIPDVPPTAANRVRVRGKVYAVEGQPADWRLGTWRPGLVVQTTLTEG